VIALLDLSSTNCIIRIPISIAKSYMTPLAAIEFAFCVAGSRGRARSLRREDLSAKNAEIGTTIIGSGMGKQSRFCESLWQHAKAWFFALRMALTFFSFAPMHAQDNDAVLHGNRREPGWCIRSKRNAARRKLRPQPAGLLPQINEVARFSLTLRGMSIASPSPP
jgi:hypothetical protein